jgi:hypothetical protein
MTRSGDQCQDAHNKLVRYQARGPTSADTCSVMARAPRLGSPGRPVETWTTPAPAEMAPDGRPAPDLDSDCEPRIRHRRTRPPWAAFHSPDRRIRVKASRPGTISRPLKPGSLREDSGGPPSPGKDLAAIVPGGPRVAAEAGGPAGSGGGRAALKQADKRVRFLGEGQRTWGFGGPRR